MKQLKLTRIAKELSDPEYHLKKMGPIVVLGNTPLDRANIVLLPEIHDDPKSLMVQALLLAREKRKPKQFIVLDESLASLRRSSWELFSQKALEILAATSARKDKLGYAPSRFERSLASLAQKFKLSLSTTQFI